MNTLLFVGGIMFTTGLLFGLGFITANALAQGLTYLVVKLGRAILNKEG